MNSDEVTRGDGRRGIDTNGTGATLTSCAALDVLLNDVAATTARIQGGGAG
jgi:hypothetical protein